jgi:predicted peptidase
MRKTVMSAVMGAALCLSLLACGHQTTSQQTTSQETVSEETTSEEIASEEAPVAETSSDTSVQGAETSAANPIGTVANDIAEDEDALVSTYPERFTQQTYEDPDTGLAVTYNLFLPANYDENASYPMVVFIGDSTCANGDPSRSLTQGLGALVWASDAWQAANPTIVCVPTYPETILDDHNGYSTTEYVELTKRLIDTVASEYAVDASRVYGTGQSMGCMTTLILASEYPDLYAGCMFVDGQWDVSTLAGLEGQSFVYFAAEDDQPATNGMNEVKAMFDTDSVPYATAQWDGTWSPEQRSEAAEEMAAQNQKANFISWASGTIDAGEGGGMGGAAYHMASFDYAYRCIAAMEWLFQQA